MVVHIAGANANRKKSQAWARAHGPVLQKEYSLVGFGPKAPSAADAEGGGLARSASSAANSEKIMKEKSLSQFISYASGRQNVAFVDFELTLLKRYNPIILAVEKIGSFFMESMTDPIETVQATMYPFDGKEVLTVPGMLPGSAALTGKSNYDNFVWAIVNKGCMKTLRDERYDLSITTTKDHPKLPIWATVMTESAEITDTMLTPELVAAVEKAGEQYFQSLIISDQPINRPTTIEECVSKKRVFLSVKLPAESEFANTMPLFEYFLSLPDRLVEKAHWRPEVLRKVQKPREEIVRKINKVAEDEKAEERAIDRDRLKKQKRDAELRTLKDPKQQKKFLEKEKEREMKKSMKKQTVKG